MNPSPNTGGRSNGRRQEPTGTHVALIDSGHVRKAAELMAPGCRFVAPGGDLEGPEQFADFFATYERAFPNGRHSMLRAVEFEDAIAAEGIWTGTHTGPLVLPQGEIQPTGRSVSLRFHVVLRVTEGRAVSIHNYFDRIDLMAQLGLASSAATA